MRDGFADDDVVRCYGIAEGFWYREIVRLAVCFSTAALPLRLRFFADRALLALGKVRERIVH